MSTFLGMRGTADWVTDERPKSWRETILYLFPQGKALLTAMMSKMSKASVDDPEFNWWTQVLESAAGTITGIYTDVGMGSAYTSGGAEGDTLYIKASEDDASQVRAGHQVLLRYTDDSRVDVNGKVTSVILNGANSVIAVRLLEDDDNTGGGADLSDADRFIVIGNINPEGGEMPAAIAKNPSKFYNYTQIFRTPLEITRTARKTKLRTEDSYQKAKREALEMHSIEMEWNTLFGIRTEKIGDNGKKERTTMGLVPFVRANAAANVDDYRFTTKVTAASTWLAGGSIWLDAMFEQLARYAMLQDMVWLCGSGAIAAINKLAKNEGTINLTPTQESFGLKVTKWLTPFGDINLMTHPLMSQEVSTRNMIVGVTPKDLRFRYIDDTTFYAEGEKQNTGHGRIDGTKEEYLTEAGYEYEHPEHIMVLDGLGEANTLT